MTLAMILNIRGQRRPGFGSRAADVRLSVPRAENAQNTEERPSVVLL